MEHQKVIARVSDDVNLFMESGLELAEPETDSGIGFDQEDNGTLVSRKSNLNQKKELHN
ncbi:hypothetical protein KBF61_03955 [Candidatus Saccharibacteria bacterium]|nr:hypothetical protein [Candidatus Saccharibacteria bacterium]